jgi:hypothetical protein
MTHRQRLAQLVEFLHHGNTQIRQIGEKHETSQDLLTLTVLEAAQELVPYSSAQPSLFKRNQFEPVKDLKLLLKDYPPIAKNALTSLVNISNDPEVIKRLIEDDAFMESLFRKIMVCFVFNACR